MGGNENKRQKKLAQRKSKRKKTLLHKKKVGDSPGVILLERLFSKSVNDPLYECLVPESLSEVGMGPVMISRQRETDGQIATGLFLLDLLCLGVKNAMFSVVSRTEYEAMVRRAEAAGQRMRESSPECARKLVEDAMAYAKELGFSPQRDYQIARQIFGNIDTSRCETTFKFGKDGKPLYVSGPNETPGDIQRILNQLERSCGVDGFNYLVPGEVIEVMEDDFDDDDFFDEEEDT
jgi:hypothetical protein